MDVTKVAKIRTKTRKRIIKKKNSLFFAVCVILRDWMQGDITAEISEATHSIRTITVDIQIESNQTTDFLEIILKGGGWGAAVWWKWRNIRKGQESPDRGWRKIIIIRVFFCLSNDDRKAEVDVTATVYLHWMVKWKCPPIFLSISPKPPCHNFFFTPPQPESSSKFPTAAPS